MKNGFFLVLILLFSQLSFCQTEEIEKNLALLKTSIPDTQKIKALTELCFQLSHYDTEKSLKYGQEALALSKKIGDDKGLATAHTNLGITYWYMGRLDDCERNFRASLKMHLALKDTFMLGRDLMNLGSYFYAKGEYDSALVNYKISLAYKKKLNRPNEIAQTYHNIALVYGTMGNYNKALEQYFDALKIVEKAGHKKSIAMTTNNIGNVYFDMEKNEKALEYYLRSVKLKEELGSPPQELALGYNNIANIYARQKNDSLCLKYNMKALDLRISVHDSSGIAASYNNLGLLYEAQHSFSKAEEYHKKSLVIRERQQNPEEILQSYINLGTVYKWMKKVPASIQSYDKALGYAKQINSLKWIAEAYSGLADVHGESNNFKEAYAYEKLLRLYTDSLLNKENQKQITEMESKYKSEKKQLEIDNLNKASALKDSELKRKDAEVKKQNLQKTFFGIGFLLVLVLAFFIFRSYRIKKKSNVALEFQKALVEEKQKELLDSIHYAVRIQNSLLPS
jgi:tetratricopeptide (TPR) repeat protein